MAEREILIRNYQPSGQAQVTVQEITRQLSALEEQVDHAKTWLDQINVDVQWVYKQRGTRAWARVLPWNTDFQIWSYVALLSAFMLAAFAAQMVWG
jgi:hypothetical protein